MKQGKGGVYAVPGIVLDFHMWLVPALKLEMVRMMKENR